MSTPPTIRAGQWTTWLVPIPAFSVADGAHFDAALSALGTRFTIEGSAAAVGRSYHPASGPHLHVEVAASDEEHGREVAQRVADDLLSVAGNSARAGIAIATTIVEVDLAYRYTGTGDSGISAMAMHSLAAAHRDAPDRAIGDTLVYSGAPTFSARSARLPMVALGPAGLAGEACRLFAEQSVERAGLTGQVRESGYVELRTEPGRPAPRESARPASGVSPLPSRRRPGTAGLRPTP